MAGRSRIWVFFLLPALLLGGIGERDSTEGRRQGKGIVLIVIDTLAAKHLGFMGYKRDTSPFLDDFAERCVVFDRAYAPRATTLPSFTSLFSGYHPLNHNVLENGVVLPKDLHLLTDDFRDAGFATWGIPAARIIGAQYGLNGGFDYYANTPANAHPASRIIERVGRILTGSPRFGEPSFSDVKKPLLLFIHFYDPHTDYTPDPSVLELFADPGYAGPVDGYPDLFLKYNDYDVELNEADLRHVRDLYDAEIRTLDNRLRELFELLERVGLMGDSVVVFTADHGENLGEHHYITHGPPYEAGLHIPLMIHFPGDFRAGEHIDALVENTDILPTLMDIFEIDIPEGIDGQSLLPLIDDAFGTAKGTRDCLVAVGGMRPDGEREVSVFDGRHRLVLVGEPCLYDISVDPSEEENIAWMLPDLRNELFEVVELVEDDASSFEMPMHDAETMEMLRSLGYVR